MAACIAEKLNAAENHQFNPVLSLPALLKNMNEEERRAAISANPDAGHMLCRCNEVTEADVASALHTKLPVLCLDALKWAHGATMGRCHGGFCMPELAKVVAREAGIAPGGAAEAASLVRASLRKRPKTTLSLCGTNRTAPLAALPMRRRNSKAKANLRKRACPRTSEPIKGRPAVSRLRSPRLPFLMPMVSKPGPFRQALKLALKPAPSKPSKLQSPRAPRSNTTLLLSAAARRASPRRFGRAQRRECGARRSRKPPGRHFEAVHPQWLRLAAFWRGLTGPEYASRELATLEGLDVHVVRDASVRA